METDFNEIMETAREHFREGRYSSSEPILNQMILSNQKNPEIFHMLATIYYDQGKFNKAIHTFKRALEIDPAFTDASIGLSIILNDLGKYEEGQKIFNEAKTMLDKKSADGDPYVSEKLAFKHDELGEMYFQYKRYKEALDQYYKALHLSTRTAELTMKVVECHLKLNQGKEAVKQLKTLIKEYPAYIPARIKLGKIYYDAHQVPEAINQWELVLRREPKNSTAKDYLRLAEAVEITGLENANI